MSEDHKKRAMRRIRKCLELSKSDNAHEAAIALRQAKALMEKYSIEMDEALRAELQIRDTSSDKQRKSNFTQPELALMEMVCEFFGCTMFLGGNWPIIVGEAPRPEIAEYAIETLLRQMRRQRKENMANLEKIAGVKIPLAHKRQVNRIYGFAWVAAASRKVEGFAVGVTDSEKERHFEGMKKHYGMNEIPEGKSAKISLDLEDPLNAWATSRGVADGKEVNLNHGIGGSEPSRLTG